ncbi:MAG TPA: ABC transporter substrate-binding protein [Vicinamibacterales bacterium]|nr:ABC transporter substrate-binding protein [Vicinamibacterales bacterium]
MGYRRGTEQVVLGADRRSDDTRLFRRRQIGSPILCGVFVLALVASNACRQSSQQATSPQPTEVVVGVPEGNTPDLDLGIPQFLRLLSFESLTTIGRDGRALPQLAERWEWEKENTRLRVFLRTNVLLHDGRPFTGETAAAFVHAAVTNPANVASFPALADLVNVSAEGNQLVFDMARPAATLPDGLTVPLDKGPDLVGTGPYHVVSQQDSMAVLEAFDRYYKGKPTIDRVVVKAFDALRPTWASLLRGELNVVYDVPVDAVEFVRNEEIDVVSVPRWYQHHVTLNLRDGRFKSPLVRKALNLAVDRVAIVQKVLHGAGTVSAGPIYPQYWAFDSTAPTYPFDPEGAKALLETAGYRLRQPARPSDGPPARLRFTCLVPQDFTTWQRIALEVQKDLFNVGVDMQFRVVPLKEFNELVFTGRFEAAFINMISGPTPSRSYMWWRSARKLKGLYNVFGYDNDQAEEQFEVLLRSANEAAIRSATSKLQRAFYDDPPAVFIAFDTRTRAISRRFHFPTDERDPMWALWRWTLASSRGGAH